MQVMDILGRMISAAWCWCASGVSSWQSLILNNLVVGAAQEFNVPFIADGGTADGRGFAAALALGAALSHSGVM